MMRNQSPRSSWKEVAATASRIASKRPVPVSGIGRLGSDSERVSPVLGYGTPPIMLASAIASRYAKVGTADVPFLVTMPLALGWSGFWLAHGLAGDTDHVARSAQGGLLVGAGFGFLGATAVAGGGHVRADGPRRAFSRCRGDGSPHGADHAVTGPW